MEVGVGWVPVKSGHVDRTVRDTEDPRLTTQNLSCEHDRRSRHEAV